MTAENPGTLMITRRFDFPIERVFDAWLDPARAGMRPLCNSVHLTATARSTETS